MSKELTVQEALKMKVGTRFNTNKGTGTVVIKASSEFEDDNRNVLPAKLDSDYIINNEYKINNAVNRILDIMD